jgi:UDP-N-acetylglucosamine 2-epimerase (non-hydrolysing)
MKVLTVLGTRPELIRLCRLIATFDELTQHVLVHTGQNSDPALSDVFFSELGVREPDYRLGITGSSFGNQVGRLFLAMDEVLQKERPDVVLVLGDTNSGLVTLLARRMGIPVYHLEAGNRCYDPKVPEEVNRRVIDHSSSLLMPYTQRSKENLIREGIPAERIIVIGNPIFEVLEWFSEKIAASSALERLGLRAGKYFLVTMHRAETVDVEARLRALMSTLVAIRERYGQPVVCSVHPRTRDRLKSFGIDALGTLTLLEPLGFFDFVSLEKAARCVITDSGTVQEECSIFRVPSVTVRDVTERPETIEAGSNVLSGVLADDVLRTVDTVLRLPAEWTPPEGYLEARVAAKVARIVLGRRPEL